MIQLRVKEVANERGITTIKALAERAALAYDTAADLWHGRMQRIDRDVLSRVCSVLEVTPGELLTFTPVDGEATQKSQAPGLVGVALSSAY